MDEPFSNKRLLALRKLTRAIAELFRGQLKEHLATLTPLFRPQIVLGQHVENEVKTFVKGTDAAFKEMQALYAKIGSSRPFSFTPELKAPLQVISTALEFMPAEYAYQAKTERDTKTVTVTSPLKWGLSYSGFGLRRIRELAGERTRTTHELETAVQHTLMLHSVLTRQPNIGKLFEALRFPIAIEQAAGLGELPVVTISGVIGTIRPPDEVIIENTEVSGTDSFEEVVDLSQIASLRDPFREKLTELVQSHGEQLPVS
jgi:hypothetical protein